MSASVAERPRVSVVIPAYNAIATLGGTITGALTQTYPNVEVVVVDDGSTDGTHDLAAAYADAVVVVHRPNGGLSAARNTGAQRSTGQLLVFCDADDILLPPAVASMVDCWEHAGGGRRAVTCNAYAMTGEGVNPRRALALRAFPPPDRQRAALLRVNIALAIALVPKQLWSDLGGFDETLPMVEDWDFWLRAVFSGTQLLYQRAPHALWRWQANSLSSNRDTMFAWEHEVFRRFADRMAGQLTAEESKILHQRLTEGSPEQLRRTADDALLAGDLQTARRLYRQTLKRLPQDRKLWLRTWSMSLLPPTGHLWRRRILSIERAMARLGAPTQSSRQARDTMEGSRRVIS